MAIDFYWAIRVGGAKVPGEQDTAIKKPSRGNSFAIVPLADSTIYEMEQPGEFPRRFALTPRCVVLDLSEVQAWLTARRSNRRSRFQIG